MNIKEQYNELICYNICESMYDNMYKHTNYNSFINMCSNIKSYVESDIPILPELGLVIKMSVNNIENLYGISHDEVKKHVLIFLNKEMYLKYHKIVHTIKINCKNSYHI